MGTSKHQPAGMGSAPTTYRGSTAPIAGSFVVVTGATSGVGRAIAEAFAEAGAEVVALGRNRERLGLIGAHPSGRVEAIEGDLTEPAELEAVVDRILGHGRSLDLLVHAAGVFAGGAFAASSLDDLDRQMRTNVRMPYALTCALLPSLIAACGQIVFINSSSAIRAAAGVSAYSATKHALRAIADSLRDEVNGSGVRVLSVYLGQTATPMQEAIYRSAAKPYDPDRLIQPEDVAQAILSMAALPARVEATELTLRPTRKPG